MKEVQWFPYIKPTRRIHESGYRIFEVGYVNRDQKRKVIVGECSDHVALWDHKSLNVDLLKNGCIRFHSHLPGLHWGIVASSAFLKIGEVGDEEIQRHINNQ